MYLRDIDEWKMYDLQSDPNETMNVIGTRLKTEKILSVLLHIQYKMAKFFDF